jgi:voltage-gated potassium channel
MGIGSVALVYGLFVSLCVFVVSVVEEDLSFGQSVYFTLVTLTTVGFGDVVPSTPTSKLVVCVIVLLNALLFAGFVSAVVSQWKGSLVALLVTIVSVCVSMLVAMEDLSIADALYLSVITISTVGYGDITPKTIGGKVVTVVLALVGSTLLALIVVRTEFWRLRGPSVLFNEKAGPIYNNFFVKVTIKQFAAANFNNIVKHGKARNQQCCNVNNIFHS